MQPLYQNLTKVEPRGSGEKSKAPRFFLGALNLFILRREQNWLKYVIIDSQLL